MEWNSSGNYQRDNDNKSFVFSVTNKQKFRLTMPEYTVYGGNGYGPTFGGGHDIYITNNANTNRSSYFNVPHSYNTMEGAQKAAKKNQKRAKKKAARI